jgi:hypothetical protein
MYFDQMLMDAVRGVLALRDTPQGRALCARNMTGVYLATDATAEQRAEIEVRALHFSLCVCVCVCVPANLDILFSSLISVFAVLTSMLFCKAWNHVHLCVCCMHMLGRLARAGTWVIFDMTSS